MISTATSLVLENNDMNYAPENEIYITLDRFEIDMGELIEVLHRHVPESAPPGLYSIASLEPIATENSVIFYKQPLPKNPKIREVYHVPRYADVVKLKPIDIYVYTGGGSIFEVARDVLLRQFSARTKSSPEKLIVPAEWMRCPSHYLSVDRPLIPYFASKLGANLAKVVLAEILDIPNFNYSPLDDNEAITAYIEDFYMTTKRDPAVAEALLNLKRELSRVVGRYVNHIHRVEYNPRERKLTIERGIDHFAYLYHQQEIIREVNGVDRENDATQQEMIREAIDAMDRVRHD